METQLGRTHALLECVKAGRYDGTLLYGGQAWKKIRVGTIILPTSPVASHPHTATSTQGIPIDN